MTAEDHPQTARDQPERRLRLLLVDDEPALRTALARALRQRFEVTTARDALDALRLLHAHVFDIVLTDHDMPERTGSWLLTRVRRSHPSVRRVLMSGHPRAALQIDANDASIQHFFQKPVLLQELIEILEEDGAG